MVERLSRIWAAATVLLLLLACSDILFPRGSALTDYFLQRQDLPILAATGVAVVVLGRSRRLRLRASALADRCAARAPGAAFTPLLVVCGLAALVGAISFLGVGLVFEHYPLSMDEFLATFDAVIFGHGQTMAPLAPEWRGLAPALENSFMLPIQGNAFWVSAYLPVNASLRALAGAFGAAELLNPGLAALSVVATFAIGRRLWPDRSDLALVAAILLATSSQLLLTAMTPYAMTAHMALNLAWLWLFLRRGWLGHAGAILVAFLACGLHQLIFHPLFAAPFVLQLWLDRRWMTATLYTFAYTAICFFWILYWPLAIALAGAAPAAATGVGAHWFVDRATALILHFDPAKIGVMAKNLIRLMTWQNPLSIPLALASFWAALHAKGTLRSMALGLVLSLVVMFVVLPYQGHGWGYRYLHGFLGSVCLLAAFSWGRLTEGFAPAEKRAATVAFGSVAAISLLVLAPVRAWQAHRFARPYAAAGSAISSVKSQVVFVDDTGIAQDLIRNDPYLRNRPIVLNLGSFTQVQMRELCSRHSVSLFDRADALRFGVLTFNTTYESEDLGLEAQFRAACPLAATDVEPRPAS